MRVISLIPSITETLINCQVNVVGRTRFCIHPAGVVDKITTVGGTKDINWSKVDALKPDIVILDKEENTLEMAQQCQHPYLVLHITAIDTVSKELAKLATRLSNKALIDVATRWQLISATKNKSWQQHTGIPAELDKLTEDSQPLQQIKHIDYMIWREPWMAIGPNTFIWSVLEKLGFAQFLKKRDDKYPNLGDNLAPDDNTFYLFSSEPFPFARYKDELAKQGFSGAIIDGESYSWYGTRSLDFLEQQLSLNQD